MEIANSIRINSFNSKSEILHVIRHANEDIGLSSLSDDLIVSYRVFSNSNSLTNLGSILNWNSSDSQPQLKLLSEGKKISIRKFKTLIKIKSNRNSVYMRMIASSESITFALYKKEDDTPKILMLNSKTGKAIRILENHIQTLSMHPSHNIIGSSLSYFSFIRNQISRTFTVGFIILSVRFWKCLFVRPELLCNPQEQNFQLTNDLLVRVYFKNNQMEIYAIHYGTKHLWGKSMKTIQQNGYNPDSSNLIIKSCSGISKFIWLDLKNISFTIEMIVNEGTNSNSESLIKCNIEVELKEILTIFCINSNKLNKKVVF